MNRPLDRLRYHVSGAIERGEKDAIVEIKVNPVHLAAAKFRVADDAWGNELRRLFGRNAGDIRYTKQGRGENGSELRRLHDIREAARQEWEVRTGMKAD